MPHPRPMPSGRLTNPPADHSPGAVRYVASKRYDVTALVAALVQLAFGVADRRVRARWPGHCHRVERPAHSGADGIDLSRHIAGPDAPGQTLHDAGEGLTLYLTEEARLGLDEQRAEHFFALLPYAIALKADEAWEARFDALDDRGAMAGLVTWYRALREQDQDAATLAAIIVPAVVASGNASAAGTATGGGGASAGGW